MEEHRRPAEAERLPGEVVEQYRQPEPGEVVERYTRPLPGRSAPARRHRRRRRRRRGLWVFLVCLTVTLGIAAGTLAWSLLRPRETGGRRGGPGGGGAPGDHHPRLSHGGGRPAGGHGRPRRGADDPGDLPAGEPLGGDGAGPAGGKASVGTGVIFRSGRVHPHQLPRAGGGAELHRGPGHRPDLLRPGTRRGTPTMTWRC